METINKPKFSEGDIVSIGDLYLKNGVSVCRVSGAKFKNIVAMSKEVKPSSAEEYGQINRESQLLNIIIVIKENGRT